MDKIKIGQISKRISGMIKSNRDVNTKKKFIEKFKETYDYEEDTVDKLLGTEGDIDQIQEIISNLKIVNMDELFREGVDYERFEKFLKKKSDKLSLNCERILELFMCSIENQCEWEMIKLAIENGYDVDYSCEHGARLLFQLCIINFEDEQEEYFQQYVDLLEYLLSKGANPNKTEGDEGGYTDSPFAECVTNNNYVFAKKIASAPGFDPTAKYQGESYYDAFEDEEIRKLLIRDETK